MGATVLGGSKSNLLLTTAKAFLNLGPVPCISPSFLTSTQSLDRHSLMACLGWLEMHAYGEPHNKNSFSAYISPKSKNNIPEVSELSFRLHGSTTPRITTPLRVFLSLCYFFLLAETLRDLREQTVDQDARAGWTGSFLCFSLQGMSG